MGHRRIRLSRGHGVSSEPSRWFGHNPPNHLASTSHTPPIETPNKGDWMRYTKFTTVAGTIALAAVGGVVCADNPATLSAEADHGSSLWAVYRPESDRNH